MDYILSSCFEEHDRYLADIEVDVMLGFVSDVGAEISPDDAMPSSMVAGPKIILDVRGDLLVLEW